jgi:hypothetical protein
MLNASTANTIPPDDILQEISYAGSPVYITPTFTDTGLAIYQRYETETEPGCTINVYGCGWQDQEQITVRVLYPDHSERSYAAQALSSSAYPIADVYIPLAPSDPVGEYQITFDGPSGRISKTIPVVAPSGPAVYFNDGQLQVVKFQPGEKARFFVYEKKQNQDGVASLVEWIDFRTDQDGKKTILVEQSEIAGHFMDNNYFFWVLGSQTGLLMAKEPVACGPWSLDIDYITKEPSASNTCGNLQSRLAKGGRGRVAFTDGKDMRIRSRPTLDADILFNVPEGTEFTLADGPRCVDGMIWWQVLTDDEHLGWMAETQNGEYLIEP